ncbi:MAG: hypothetical protein KF878_03280 [Planctomycetes bacterium]|nr:hypothetical protein [Planctomycetota bacterium]
MPPPPGKDFPALRADRDFKALSAGHQAALLEFCRDGAPHTPEVREADAVLFCSSLVAVTEPVRDTLLQSIKEDSRRFRRLLGLTGTSSFGAPRLNGAPATGDEVARCQRRLVHVFALLSDAETRAQSGANHRRKEVITNTIEWFIFAGLPIEFATSSDSSLMGEYDGVKHRMILYHESALKLRPEGVGDAKETLRKLAHEVNHACRRKVEDQDSPGVRLVDEFHAYLTELIAGGQVVTEQQVSETFGILAAAPYRLKKVIDSDVGVSYRKALKYDVHGVDLPSSNTLRFPVPSPGTANQGWHHTNAVPGL